MNATDTGARPAAPLADMTMGDLRAEAARLGVTIPRGKTRDQGIEIIRAARRRAARAKPGGAGTIRETAERLLRETARPYSHVLDELKLVFPRANTSRSCLRWYATQMRLRGEELPERLTDHPALRGQTPEAGPTEGAA